MQSGKFQNFLKGKGNRITKSLTVKETCLIILFLSSADFKQTPPNIPSPNINMKKRRHGEEEIYYIPVRAFHMFICHDCKFKDIKVCV